MFASVTNNQRLAVLLVFSDKAQIQLYESMRLQDSMQGACGDLRPASHISICNSYTGPQCEMEVFWDIMFRLDYSPRSVGELKINGALEHVVTPRKHLCV